MPPLAALRAFEAAARHLNFSAAARELNVTHAAIAQQVRALERHLGVALIFRDGRSMALSPEAAILATAARDGFGMIAQAVTDLNEQSQLAPIKVTITPSFASQWLMPRLKSFWDKHPDIAVSLHPSSEVVDMRREGMDVAIRFGDGNWPGLEVKGLVHADYIIAAAPSLSAGRKALSLEEMRQMPWVAEAKWPEQWALLSEIGVTPENARIKTFETVELALSAARQGYGLILHLAALMDDDIGTGRLDPVYHGSEDRFGYFVCTLPVHHRPGLREFLRWLRSQV
ncbi:MAG: LysR family transcriptional regulator [Rhodobacteraceae bacterium]|nr:LysR family transcriptional regulator [Paracoccaceae bacterium]